MRHLHSYGPGLVVLAAGGLALLAGPLAVREFTHAQTSVEIVQAANRLEDTNVLEQINQANRDIARMVESSVVHVSVIGEVRRRTSSQPYVSSGSGWVYDELGHIVTNAHVVDGASRVQVQLSGGDLRDAELVGLDLPTDIAVLKVDASNLHPARRGDSNDLQQGDLVYAFGSPFDFRFSMSSGIVSGLGRSAGLNEILYQDFIQVDAAINPGNSGGPLTDFQGRVIGMNTAIATGRGNVVGQGQFAGIGLAIPMTMIESVVSQLIDTGDVQKGFLGVSVDDPANPLLHSAAAQPIYAFVHESFRGEGAVITGLDESSPAGKAGLRIGDVITRIDGRPVTSDRLVPAIISSKRPGSEITLEVWRISPETQTSENLDFRITLGKLEPARRATPLFIQAIGRLGIEDLETATQANCRDRDVPFRRGVLVGRVRPESEIASVMPVGSIVVEVLGQAVVSEDELYLRVGRYLENVRRMPGAYQIPLTFVTPDGQVRNVVLPLL